MLLSSSLTIAISLVFIFGSRASVVDNHWPSKKRAWNRTPRPTKWAPPSYETEREWMKNWDKPKAHKKTQEHRRPDDYSSKGCGDGDHSFDDTTEKFLEHNGIRRRYIVHLPPTYNHGSVDGHAIVLNLHGYTGNPEQIMEGSLMNEHADANDYIAVYPEGSNLGESEWQGVAVNLTHWNDLSYSGSPSSDGPTCAWPSPSAFVDALPSACRDVFRCNVADCTVDDIDFIESLLDELEATYCIDRSRIYVTGFSNGGMMAQRLGCELNHRLAAIAPQHGQPTLGFNCAPKHDEPMPIINIWGTNDIITPGVEILAALGFYFTPVSHVQYKYGKHNKCNVDEQLPVAIASASDGILEWQCVGYNGCERGNGEYGVDAMSCSWNGEHADYPFSNGENFALNVIWDFFQNHTKISPRAK